MSCGFFATSCAQFPDVGKEEDRSQTTSALWAARAFWRKVGNHCWERSWAEELTDTCGGSRARPGCACAGWWGMFVGCGEQIWAKNPVVSTCDYVPETEMMGCEKPTVWGGRCQTWTGAWDRSCSALSLGSQQGHSYREYLPEKEEALWTPPM